MSDFLFLLVLYLSIWLTQNLGLCPLMGGSKKLTPSVARGLINAFVLTMDCGGTRIHYFLQVRISITAGGLVSLAFMG